jgi:hypothetical protein
MKLTNEECRKARLPGREPTPPHDEIDWYPIEPAQKLPTSVGFEEAAHILGDGERAA